MPDEAIPAQHPEDARIEFEKSRESAVRLLETLAQKVGAARPVHTAASGVQRAAQYVQSLSAKQVAAGIGDTLRRRPVYAIALALVAGFLVGRALRPRAHHLEP